MKIIGATYYNDNLIVISYCLNDVVVIDYENNWCYLLYNDILVAIG